mgnify:CR=1 FL=1
MENDLLSNLTMVKHELISDGERQSARVIEDAVKEIEKLNAIIEKLKKENNILTIIEDHA